MSWARLDDACTDHLKLRRAGTAGLALWTASIVWCSRHLTDGFIPTDMLHDIWRPVGESFDADAACARLVAAGLWDEVEGGWQVHDYLDYNMSRAEVMSRREQAADRQRRRRTKAHPEPVTHGVTEVVTRDIQRDSQGTYSVSHATPTRPDPSHEESRAPARVAQRVPRSSLSGLKDPLGEWPDGVSSEEYPWRAFRAEGEKLGLHVPPHPGHNDRSKALDIERAALDGARLAHERTGRDMADAYRRLVTMAVREYAKRRREKPDAHPWKIGYIASAWADLTENAIPARAT